MLIISCFFYTKILCKNLIGGFFTRFNDNSKVAYFLLGHSSFQVMADSVYILCTGDTEVRAKDMRQCDIEYCNIVQIVIKNLKRRWGDMISKLILREFPSKRSSTNGIQSLLERNDARGSADVISTI